MEPELIRGFPGLSISLKNVSLRDSLWASHKHDLLKARNVYLTVDAFSLISGPAKIKKISIADGEIYVFSDSLGYSNTDIFKDRNSKADSSRAGGSVNRINFRDTKFIYENKLKKKYFNLSIRDFQGIFEFDRNGWKAKADLHTLVNQLQFNTEKGSFLRNKHLEMTNLLLEFNYDHKKLTIPWQKIEIEDNNFRIAGSCMFAKTNSNFAVKLKAYDIPYSEATELLLPRITKRLKSYNLKKPITVEALIRGKLKNATQMPLVNAKWVVKNNTLTTGEEVIKDCSFTGSFTNEVVPATRRDDLNSSIVFNDMSGKWYNIGFLAPRVEIRNLTSPVIEGKFISDFSLKKLNAVSGETFYFTHGSASLNLVYKASLLKGGDTGPGFIVGNIRIINGAATYRPRNLKFNNIAALLNFKGHDLFVQNMKVSSGKTNLNMEGSLRNFLNLYYTDPRKIILDWHITSPQFNLGEFLVFLGRRNPQRPAKTPDGSRKASTRIFQQLDQVLDQASAHLLVKVDKLIYKDFTASKVTSDITMKQSGISINRVSLNHAGGNLIVTGDIDQSGSVNKITTEARITNVDVQTLFTSFENFGQDAITNQNLRGVFYGSTKMAATMKNNGEMVPRSFFGTVTFDIRNGALVNFEPMEKIGRFTFPNRNFSNIRFRNLKNTLEFRGEKVYIPPMLIESSVFNIFLNGVYSFTTGTNIAMEVPLRNPQQDALLPDSLKEARIRRGIVLNLSAVDGLDGNVKIKLGKKSDKNSEALKK